MLHASFPNVVEFGQALMAACEVSAEVHASGGKKGDGSAAVTKQSKDIELVVIAPRRKPSK